jgi:MYXO-CTERM domain-containing protein
MLSRLIRFGFVAAVVGVTIGTGFGTSPAQAFFPQSTPPFPPPPHGVEPQPPIIVPEIPVTPPPPVKSTPEPGTMALALVGAGAAFVVRRRKAS